MASSSSSSSGRRRRRSKTPTEEPKNNRTLVGILLAAGSALLIFLFFKFTDDPTANQAPPAATPVPMRTPDLSLPGAPTPPPKDLSLTLDEYCEKLVSLRDSPALQSDFIRQTAGNRVNWRARVLSVDTGGGIKSAVLGSATKAGDLYDVNISFDHPSRDTTSLVFLLEPRDMVQVTGTISLDSPHLLIGDTMVLIH